MIRRYRVYGVTLETAVQFGFPLPTSDEPADLSFSPTDVPPEGLELDERTLLYEEPPPTADRPSNFIYSRLGRWDVIQVRGVADYYLAPDEIRFHLRNDAWASLVPVHLFGLVMALWLERRGVVCLHGSAVESDGVAVVFLAVGGAGKSSLAAHFTTRGHPLLTDDLVALDRTDLVVHARPGYPQLGLWPDQVRWFAGHHKAFPLVRPDVAKVRVPVGVEGIGSMAVSSLPVGRVYLPMRGAATDVVIDRLPAAQAFMQLLHHSFLPREVERLGLQADRLPVLARLFDHGAMCTLRFPDGVDRLEEVRAAVQTDLRSVMG